MIVPNTVTIIIFVQFIDCLLLVRAAVIESDRTIRIVQPLSEAYRLNLYVIVVTVSAGRRRHCILVDRVAGHKGVLDLEIGPQNHSNVTFPCVQRNLAL